MGTEVFGGPQITLRARRIRDSQAEFAHEGGDVGSGRAAVRILEASQEGSLEAIFLGPDHLDRVARQQGTDLRAALQRHVPSEPSEKSCAVRIAHPGWVNPCDFARNRYVHSGLACDLDTGSLGTPCNYPDSDALQDFLVRPAGLLPDEAILVVVGEQVRRPIDQPLDLRSVEPGHLLGRIGEEAKAPTAALLGMPLHSLRIIRRNYDQIEAACALRNGL